MKPLILLTSLVMLSLLPLRGADSEGRLFIVDDIALMTPGGVPKVSDGAYALRLNEADAISYARYLIILNKGEEEPPGGVSQPRFFLKLKLAAGSDSINRDYSTPGAPHWGWHVAEFYEFVDGSETQSVGPLMVESDPEYWQSQDFVVFESHSVVGELPLQWVSIDEHGRKVSWFGRFVDDHYPWIDHNDYGWLYIHGFDPNDIWFWSLEQAGWFWSSEALQDYVYNAENGHWLYRGPERWLYDFHDQAWLWKGL